MNTYKSFNYGIGVLPTSVFVDFQLENNFDIDAVYQEIIKFNNIDVIFINLSNVIGRLMWLTPRLLSEGYFVSFVHKYNEITQIPVSRVMCFLDMTNFSIKYCQFNHYTKDDLLILYNSSSIDKLIEILNVLNERFNFKGNIMLHKDNWNEELLLKYNIDYIYRYDGEIL